MEKQKNKSRSSKAIILFVSMIIIALIFGIYAMLIKKTPKLETLYQPVEAFNEETTLNSNDGSEFYGIGRGYITRVLPETTLSDIKNNFDDQTIEIYDAIDNKISDNQVVSTGMKLIRGDNEYKLSVIGDVIGNGKIGLNNVIELNLSLAGLKPRLVNEYRFSGDVNNDGSVSLLDVIKLNLVHAGLLDIVAPNSFVPEVTTTKTSITVWGETIDVKSGVKQYWFEIDNNGWVQNSDRSQNEYTFNNLNTDQEYSVRMKVEDNAGNKKTTRRVLVKTADMENANVRIQLSTEEWTNQEITVSINYNSDIANEIKQVSIDGGDWQEYTGAFKIGKNMTIKARVINRNGDVIDERQEQITNIDRLEPREFNITAISTPNSITVSGGTVDRTQTSEYGRSGIKEYIYILKRGIWEKQEITQNTSYTFENLEQGQEYEVTVIAVDYAGNKKQGKNKNGAESEEKIETTTIDDEIQNDGLGETIITPSTTDWTNGNVTVEVTYPNTNKYIKEISLDNGEHWKTYTGAEIISKNTVVIARLNDEKGNTGCQKVLEITKIDKIDPEQFDMTIKATSNSIEVCAETQDADATSEYGKSGIKEYIYKLNGEVIETTSETKYTFENLTQGQTYNIEVIAKDLAGNERSARNNNGQDGSEDVRTPTIDEEIASKGFGEITIIPNITEYTNENVIVTIVYPQIEGYIKQVSTNNGFDWHEYTGPETLDKNGIIKARLIDTNEQSGTVKELNVNYIDKLNPKEFTIETDVTTNSITVRADTDDGDETTNYCKSGLKEYEYILELDSFKKSYKTTDTSYTFDNLDQGKEYKVLVIARDNAGNERKSKNSNGIEGEYEDARTPTIEDEVQQSGQEIIITPSTLEWVKDSVTVAISYPNIIGLKKEYSIDNGEHWAEYIQEIEVTKNTVVKARLIDSKLQTGAETSLEIKNIDGLTPNEFEFELIPTTNSIKVIANTKDQEATYEYGKSDIRGYSFKIGTNDWTPVQEFGTYNFENLTQGTYYTIRVKAIDNAGNEKEAKNSNGQEGVGETVKTPTIEEEIASQNLGEIQIKQNPPANVYTNDKVMVEVIYPNADGYVREVSIDNGATWSVYESAVNVEKNTTVIARLKDSNDQIGGEKSLEIENIDKLEPTDFRITASGERYKIRVHANTFDAPATDEYACSGIKTYEYILVNGLWRWTERDENTSHEFTYISQGKTYSIEVIAIDNAGNEKIASNSGSTTVQTPVDGNITMSADKTSWTRDNVLVTATYPSNIDDLRKEIKVNDGPWQDYTSMETKVTVTENNTTVQARMMDGTNQVGAIAEYHVTIIDKESPEITGISSNVTSRTMTITVNATDGLSGIQAYHFSKDGGITWQTNSNSYTYTGLNPATTYSVQIKVVDNVGNEKIVTEQVTTNPEYTLTIDPNGGTYTGTTPITKEAGTTIVLSDISKIGYEFDGWTKNGSGVINGNTYTFENGNETLTAKWKAIKYTITYNACGGSVSPTSTTEDYESSISMPTPSKTYTVSYNTNGGNVYTTELNTEATCGFNGWYTAASGGEQKTYSTMPLGGANLYAQWTLGSVTLPTPNKDGYSFEGWCTDAGCTNVLTGTTYTPSAPTTLYAKWTQNTYTLTINPNGGTYNGSSSYTYITGTIGETVTLSEPVRAGYIFHRWDWDAGGGTLGPSEFTFTSGNATLKPIWRVEEYIYNRGTIGAYGLDVYTDNAENSVNFNADHIEITNYGGFASIYTPNPVVSGYTEMEIKYEVTGIPTYQYYHVNVMYRNTPNDGSSGIVSEIWSYNRKPLTECGAGTVTNGLTSGYGGNNYFWLETLGDDTRIKIYSIKVYKFVS